MNDADGAPVSHSQAVVAGIKAMIVSGKIGPGSRLPVEKDLATEFGVSKGSLREGVRALCIMGVLETRQGAGTYVTSLDSSLLLAPMSFMVDLQPSEHRDDLHLVRRVLESEAASRAALRLGEPELTEAGEILAGVADLAILDREEDQSLILDADVAFHRIIAHGADSPPLAALIDALADRTWRARLWLGRHHRGQTFDSHQGHLAILDALRRRDPERARLEMNHHLLMVEDRLRDEDDSDEPRHLDPLESKGVPIARG